MNFESLQTVLKRVAASRSVATTFTAAEACAAAERVIAAELPLLAGRYHPKFVKNGVLHIAVATSAVGSEIYFARETIVAQLQKRFAQIRDLRTTVEKWKLEAPQN